MSKRKNPNTENLNSDFCDFLMELANYEKNVTRALHKYNVYRKAAGLLAKHPTKIKSGEEAKRLNGIGDKIGKKIDEFIRTGQLEKLNKIRANDTNMAISELTKVSGIGPAAAANFAKVGIKDIDDLRKIIDKLNHHQKIGVKHFEDFELRIPRDEIMNLRDRVLGGIHKVDPKYKARVCGSFRRGAAASGDIDVLLSHPDYVAADKKKPELLKAVVKYFTDKCLVTDTISMGDSKFMGVCRLPEDDKETKRHFRRFDLRLIPHDQYYCALLYFTGSDMFNKDMRGRALEKGFTLNEYCIRPMGSTGIPGEPLPVSSEEDIFDYVGMKFKKPPERNL